MNTTMQNKNGLILGGLALIMAVLALLTALSEKPSSVNEVLAGMSNLDGLTITPAETGDGLKIGSSGSTVTKLISGTCSIIAQSYTMAASTSLPVDCAVTGAVSGDAVFARFATSSPTGEGWLVAQSSASTTSGFITMRIVNNTGASAVIPASIASTTQYLIIR